MADERHAAMCFIIYSYSIFNFDLNPKSRKRVYEGLKNIRKATKQEYPEWNDVTMAPNGFPEDWMGLVRDDKVREIMTEFKVFPVIENEAGHVYVVE